MTENIDFDLARARRETRTAPGVIHLNNAGSSIMPQPVVETVLKFLERETSIGGYEAAEEAAERLEAVYASIARLLSCEVDEIALVENATRAWDMAFYALNLQSGDRILTSQSEYASNVIAYLQVAKNRGVVLDVIPDDEHGQLSIDALRAMIDERVKLIAISHVPTQGGLVNPASRVGEVARRYGIPYLLDACQSVGQMPVEVSAIQCDMLSATGRKFLRGPRGTGFLYVRRAWIEKLEPPFLDLHAATWNSKGSFEIRPDARRFENWESFVAGRLGLGAAVDYALDWGLERIRRRVSGLADFLRSGLAALPGVRVHDQGLERSAIVTFTYERATPEVIKQYLRSKGVNVSITLVESARFDFEERGLNAVVRVSPHYFNSHEELAVFLEHVKSLHPS